MLSGKSDGRGNRNNILLLLVLLLHKTKSSETDALLSDFVTRWAC